MKQSAPLPDDPELLKAMVLALQGQVESLQTNEQAHLDLIAALRLTLAKLRKGRFGPSSEKIDRQIEQYELALEHAQMAHPSQDPEEDRPPVPDVRPAASDEPAKPTRGKPRVRGDVERERVVLDIDDSCPECGGELHVIGEDVSELVGVHHRQAQGD